MITDITVSPAHRRRGLLKRLMTDDLANTDLPVAALTVSEASIYGRFGFAPATFRRRLEVDTTNLTFRSYVDPGRCELMEPADMWPIISDLFDRFHRTTRGSLDRPLFYRPMLTGEIDFGSGSADTKLRGAVHLNAEGEPDGYAQWKVLDGENGKPKPVNANLLSLTGEAHLGLWQFLAGIDLTHQVKDQHQPTRRHPRLERHQPRPHRRQGPHRPHLAPGARRAGRARGPAVVRRRLARARRRRPARARARRLRDRGRGRPREGDGIDG